jgi:hypothetical protein
VASCTDATQVAGKELLLLIVHVGGKDREPSTLGVEVMQIGQLAGNVGHERQADGESKPWL